MHSDYVEYHRYSYQPTYHTYISRAREEKNLQTQIDLIRDRRDVTKRPQELQDQSRDTVEILGKDPRPLHEIAS